LPQVTDARNRRVSSACLAEALATLDGDYIRVHWNDGPAPEAPILVLLHGLTGCAQS